MTYFWRPYIENTTIRLTHNFTNYKNSLAVQKCMKNFENCTILATLWSKIASILKRFGFIRPKVMGCQREKHLFIHISWCGRGGGTKIDEYVPPVVGNNVSWCNMKYMRESHRMPLECKYSAWESLEGHNSLILGVMEKLVQSFFVGTIM